MRHPIAAADHEESESTPKRDVRAMPAKNIIPGVKPLTCAHANVAYRRGH